MAKKALFGSYFFLFGLKITKHIGVTVLGGDSVQPAATAGPSSLRKLLAAGETTVAQTSATFHRQDKDTAEKKINRQSKIFKTME